MSDQKIKMEEKILWNGKEITIEEFQQKKQTLKEQKGVELIKVSTTEYKTRMMD